MESSQRSNQFPSFGYPPFVLSSPASSHTDFPSLLCNNTILMYFRYHKLGPLVQHILHDTKLSIPTLPTGGERLMGNGD